jgi:hypothetical protein
VCGELEMTRDEAIVAYLNIAFPHYHGRTGISKEVYYILSIKLEEESQKEREQ